MNITPPYLFRLLIPYHPSCVFRSPSSANLLQVPRTDRPACCSQLFDCAAVVAKPVLFCVSADCLCLRRVLQLVRMSTKRWMRCSPESCCALNLLSTNPCSINISGRRMKTIPAAAADSDAQALLV